MGRATSDARHGMKGKQAWVGDCAKWLASMIEGGCGSPSLAAAVPVQHVRASSMGRRQNCPAKALQRGFSGPRVGNCAGTGASTLREHEVTLPGSVVRVAGPVVSQPGLQVLVAGESGWGRTISDVSQPTDGASRVRTQHGSGVRGFNILAPCDVFAPRNFCVSVMKEKTRQ